MNINNLVLCCILTISKIDENESQTRDKNKATCGSGHPLHHDHSLPDGCIVAIVIVVVVSLGLLLFMRKRRGPDSPPTIT